MPLGFWWRKWTNSLGELVLETRLWVVLRDEKLEQGLLLNEKQLFEPRSLLKWKRLCKRPRHWEATAKALGAGGRPQAPEGKCVPWGSPLDWTANRGLRFSYSGPCVWEDALQLCSGRLQFPLPIRMEPGGLPLWQIPLPQQPALLPDFWGSATAPMSTISGLTPATIVPSAYHRPAIILFKPIHTFDSND